MDIAPLPFGVLLVNLGTPEKPDVKHIRQFLREFLSDPRVIDLPRPIWWPILNLFILPYRPYKIKHMYEQIWTENGSPLREISLQQQALLSEKLADFYHRNIPVELGMNYGTPSLREGLLNLRHRGIKRVIVLPLYPQFSATTTAAVFDKIAMLLRKCPNLPDIRIINHYHDNPTYIFAIAESIRNFRAIHGKADKLIFSFHGIPKRYVDRGDPYFDQCHETARLIAQNLSLKAEDWLLTFQSRLGRAEWLKPYTLEAIKELGQEGVRHIQVVCPGFAADCLETLEEISVQNRDTFIAAGGEKFGYIPALNVEPAHLNLLATLVKNEAAGWGRPA